MAASTSKRRSEDNHKDLQSYYFLMNPYGYQAKLDPKNYYILWLHLPIDKETTNYGTVRNQWAIQHIDGYLNFARLQLYSIILRSLPA
ncbi:unnamed protein product [Dovyalis caffra]|uniref:Uncharacterized protein n=1 Tax=Dovyalis caffra TaxID=77055 RepID=A0AAV1RYX7_9ROSI|nr:unnamed protein product [Dovyalis caffra]